MSSDKSMNSRKRTQRLRHVAPFKSRVGGVPPLFLTSKLRKAVERLLPDRHYQRLRQYFDWYGCLHCSRKHVLYGGNGFCMGCISMIGKRMRKVDQELMTRKPTFSPNLEAAYLRPYNSARRLLVDLMSNIGNRPTRRTSEPKSPPKVYLRF